MDSQPHRENAVEGAATASLDPATTRRQAMPSYHPLIVVLLAVFGGALADRMWRVSWSLELAIAAVSGGTWMTACWLHRGRLAVAALLCMVSSTAACAHHQTWWLASDESLHGCLDERPTSLVFDAVVTDLPNTDLPITSFQAAGKHQSDTAGLQASGYERAGREKRHYTYRVQVVRIRDGRTWRTARGSAQVRLALEPEIAPPVFEVGDSIRVCGKASRHPPPWNPGDWDPRESARTREQVVVKLSTALGMRRLQTSRVWSARRQLSCLRRSLQRRVQQYVTKGQAGLAAALLLGRRDQMTFQDRELFVEAGIAHLLALSGLHVGLVAGVAWGLGRIGWLSRHASSIGAALLAVAYLVIAGPRASLIRATIVIVALAWSRLLGRPRSVWNVLAAAALLLAAIQPSQLFDTGAQLSFLAVAALCQWEMFRRRTPTPLERLVRESRPWWVRVVRRSLQAIGDCLSVNFAVWSITAPIAAWRFGRVAPIGILLNPLAGPLVALALYALLLLLVASLVPVTASLASLFGDLAGAALLGVQRLASLGASAPGGHWELVPPPATWAACGCCVWLGWALCTSGYTRLWLVLATIGWGGWGIATQRPSPQPGLIVTVLAVGHGNCVAIQTPSGRLWVYDAGRLGNGTLVHRALKQLMKKQRTQRIDQLFVSHEDVDHYNAVAQLLQTTTVRQLVVGPRMLTESADNYQPHSALQNLATAIQSSDVPVKRIAAGDDWVSDGVAVDVLHPPERWGLGKADNADSLVLRIGYGGHAVLLTGDAEGPGLERLMAQPIHARVVLAPHHGSPLSHPLRLVRHCKARWLLVSSGLPRRELENVSHPHVLQTAVDGALQVRIDDAGVTVRRWRMTPW